MIHGMDEGVSKGTEAYMYSLVPCRRLTRGEYAEREGEDRSTGQSRPTG